MDGRRNNDVLHMNRQPAADDPPPILRVAAARPHRLRTDIQALRGLAILLVLLHHARLLPGLKAGYLGVDVFFVVSGYLITGIVQRALLAGTFSFTEFYFRRAKRLLPAAYVTLLLTALASSLFLTRPEMKDFTWQLLGAVTFTGNIALWMQTGYFEGAAYLKPLLHVWSLSIEEQYYLLMPAALVFTPRRFWRAGVLVALAGSLALCLILVSIKPGATFYLLPTRAWEMALGSIGVLALEGSAAGTLVARLLFWPALVALLLVPFLPTGAPHPGLDALIVCTATLIIILRRHPMLNTGLPVRGLARLGDISYSLYLVHWPLLAFAANAWVSPVPGVVRLALAALAMALAWALYRWVEQPFRRTEIVFNRRSLGMTLGVSAMLVFSGFGTYHSQTSVNPVDYSFVRRGNMGLSPACEYGARFTSKPECRISDPPRIMVWGDSTAMHLMEGIVATTNQGVVQATKTVCGPLIGLSSFQSSGTYSREWANGCLAFNDSVVDYLARTPTVEVVVMASQFGQYLSGNQLRSREGGNSQDVAGAVGEREGSEDVAAEALRRSIAAVRAVGKRVVLVAPPPSASGIDFGRCLELKASGKAVFGAHMPSCAISEALFRVDRAPVQRLLSRVATESSVPVFYMDEFLCQSGICAVELDGTFLYRDGGHLTYDGSRLLGKKLDLTNRLMALAQ